MAPVEIKFVIAIAQKSMPSKINDNKKEFAFILFMNGELQKDICERVGTTSKTLQRWIDDGGWREKRSAKNITRTELVNKALLSISNILDSALDKNNEDKNFSSITDQLAKLAKFIESLDKSNSVVNEMETFMSFNKHLQSKAIEDKTLNPELLQRINRLQDGYITERLSMK